MTRLLAATVLKVVMRPRWLERPLATEVVMKPHLKGFLAADGVVAGLLPLLVETVAERTGVAIG